MNNKIKEMVENVFGDKKVKTLENRDHMDYTFGVLGEAINLMATNLGHKKASKLVGSMLNRIELIEKHQNNQPASKAIN